jgi:hypothetical protein
MKMKIWGGVDTFKGKQVRVIVCAKTKKRALELLKNVSQRYFNNYFCETGNSLELSIATVEGVWRSSGINSTSERTTFTKEEVK